MLSELGISRCAYDWRAEHVPSFEQEILAYKQHGIEFFAFWSVHEDAFKLFEKHGLHPQIWQTLTDPGDKDQTTKVESAAQNLLPLCRRTHAMGCSLGLYNHGGWGGEPKNIVAACQRLHELGQDHVGIVYNFHHGHDHIDVWAESLKQMQPYLLCVNLNGMNRQEQPKILGIGKGQHELEMIRILVASGYDGPIGILDHREQLDARDSLVENIEGLDRVRSNLAQADSGGPERNDLRTDDVSTRDIPGAATPNTDAAIYGEGVRSTEWLSPEEQRSGFHLPPGFEIRLFASEPQIAKPLNMAFDDRGRLWVTNSVEYPYPASDPEQARDKVSVLMDTDDDGTADRVTTFADGLNIPMGVMPYGDGCLCFSIPNIWYLRDTDGDGKCDQREVVLGPFDTTRDTHGMINSLRDLGDGWIYACHGFNNQSQVAGTDGHTVSLHSGNTFRFRPDGSRIENYTSGQVNPFGMTVDEWGYLYSADCHSKPITQLIRGACYPSFGRPHDGLGFLPPMVDHLHGSTAISGLLFFPPDSPIVPLREQFISGNVMTSRLNRNERIFHGATAIGKELPDFLTSDDPWFRPVDIQLGPDGYIYVADFYNKIIGHYEVPLEHPERDRTSGRIWQIRYTKMQHDVPQSNHQSLPVVRSDTRANLDELRSGLRDVNAHVVRASAELLGQYGEPHDVELLLHQLTITPDADPVLRQTIRMAIRDLLNSAASDSEVWSTVPTANLASIFLGIKRAEAAAGLLKYLSSHPGVANRDELLSHAAKNTTPELLGECVRVAQEISDGDRDKEFQLLDVLCGSQNARRANVTQPLRDWAQQLVHAELANINTSAKLLGWSTADGSAWARETRRLQGGGEAILVSSFGRGETYTGEWVSDAFPAPEKIAFWIAGHNGFPQEPDHGKNAIRLVLVETGEVLHHVTPPRNDVAREIHWDTKAVLGRDVRIECVDGDSGTAYAWLGIGKFDPAWMDETQQSSALQRTLNWTERLGLDENANALEKLLSQGGLSRYWATEVARTIASIHDNPAASVTLQFLHRSDSPSEFMNAAVSAMLKEDRDGLLETTKQACQRLSFSGQRDFAIAWSKSGADIESLINMAQMGWISREVLVDPTAAEAMAPRLSDALRDRVRDLTAGIAADTNANATLSRLQTDVAALQGNHQNGHGLYVKHCAACHQLRGEGAVVGPQLDGATTRSSDRLLEDIVTPDRNVDQAFRTTSFVLDDGRVMVGLVTSENDREITVVESTGKAIRIDPQSIELRREAGRSLMPSNIAEVLSVEDFSDLIHFLRGAERLTPRKQ
jgi:putative heme-binding domain-containing protein